MNRPRARSNATILELKEAVARGEMSAAYILGRLYEEGWGVRRDSRQAFDWYLTAAEGGMPEADYHVGTAYAFGDGVGRDEKKALVWFRKAAQHGDTTAAYMEAVAVLEGLGTRAEPVRGWRLLTAAARRGSRDAMDYLAAAYLTRRRLRQAEHWARRAAEAGDAVAPLRLREIRAMARARPAAARRRPK